MDEGRTSGHGTSVRWFALAAVALSVFSVAGARSLSWLSAPGRISVVAAAPARPAPPRRIGDRDDVDDMPTGSVPSTALVIRLR